MDNVIVRTKSSLLRWTTDNLGIFYATYAGTLDNKKTTSTMKDKTREKKK